MFANQFEWQEKLERTQSPPCSLSLFFSFSLSLTQVFTLHCNHVHVHGGCFLSVAGRQIASTWLKGICFISSQHEKCRHTHSFFFSFWMFRNDVCTSRFHLPVKAKATLCFCQQISTAGTITLYFDYLLFRDEKNIPRGYTFLWQPTIYVPFAVLYVRLIQNVIFTGSHFKCLRASCTHFIFMCGRIYRFDLC